MATKILRDVVDSNNVYLITPSISVGQRTDSIDMIGYNTASVQCLLSNVGANVKVGLERSNNNDTWANASSSGEWTTITESGTVILDYDGNLRYIRFYFVSASGGPPTVTDVTIFGGS